MGPLETGRVCQQLRRRLHVRPGRQIGGTVRDQGRRAFRGDLQVELQGQDPVAEGKGLVGAGFAAGQVHGAGRWVQGGFWRWRNIGVRELN